MTRVYPCWPTAQQACAWCVLGHAGAYETLQRLTIRPDLVDLRRYYEARATTELGRFAQGLDADQATAERGRAILDACLATIGQQVAGWTDLRADAHPTYLAYEPIEQLWRQLLRQQADWATLQPAAGTYLADASMWHPYTQPAFLPTSPD